MSIEEIIKNLEDILGYFEGCKWDPALRAAIALLRTHTDAQPNEPLTLEDTLEMHGTPAYLYFPDGGEWVLIRVVSPDREKVELVHRNGILAPIRFVFDGGGKLYRRPTKEETP